MRLFAILLALLTLSVTAPASAADQLPDSALQLRILSRDDLTLVVEVANPSNDAVRFEGVGLYFVPESTGDEPQRLGVVTAGQVVAADGTWANAPTTISVAAHASIQVKLASYCIDAERESPKPGTRYHLAYRRMPPALAVALAGAARTVASLGYDPEGAGPDAAHAPRMDVQHVTQEAVWRVRAAMPTALIGDSRDSD